MKSKNNEKKMHLQIQRKFYFGAGGIKSDVHLVFKSFSCWFSYHSIHLLQKNIHFIKNSLIKRLVLHSF
jgi:hypothetical protein